MDTHYTTIPYASLSQNHLLKGLTLWQREGNACFRPVRARCVEWAWRRRFDAAATCRATATLPPSCQKCQLDGWFFSQGQDLLISYFGGWVVFFSGYFGKIWLLFFIFCSVMKVFFWGRGGFLLGYFGEWVFLYFMYGIFFMFGYLFMRMIFRRV